MFIFQLRESESNNLNALFFGLAILIVLFLFNLKENIDYMWRENITLKTPLKTDEVITSIFRVTITPICEEYFYRYILTFYLNEYFGIVSVIIVSTVFVHIHFMNRWARFNFTYKSYIYHFISSILLSILFIETGSLIACIIVHSLLNLPSLVVVVKKILNPPPRKIFNDFDYME